MCEVLSQFSFTLVSGICGFGISVCAEAEGVGITIITLYVGTYPFQQFQKMYTVTKMLGKLISS